MKSLFIVLGFVNFLNAMHHDQKSDAQEWKVVGKKGKNKNEFPSYSKSPKDKKQQVNRTIITPNSSDTKDSFNAFACVLLSDSELKEVFEEIFKKPPLTRNQKKRARNRATQKRKKIEAATPEKYSSYLAVYNDGPYDF